MLTVLLLGMASIPTQKIVTSLYSVRMVNAMISPVALAQSLIRRIKSATGQIKWTMTMLVPRADIVIRSNLTSVTARLLFACKI